MKVPKRSIRRQQAKRIKGRAKRIIKGRRLNDDPNEPVDPKDVGRVASVHGADCSCMMCGNPRKRWGERTLKEIKEDQIEKEQKNDLNEDN
jgi:hypothetical protein